MGQILSFLLLGIKRKLIAVPFAPQTVTQTKFPPLTKLITSISRYSPVFTHRVGRRESVQQLNTDESITHQKYCELPSRRYATYRQARDTLNLVKCPPLVVSREKIEKKAGGDILKLAASTWLVIGHGLNEFYVSFGRQGVVLRNY